MGKYQYLNQYGRMTPVRGIDFPKRNVAHETYRTAELAIKQKIKVLKDFYIVDPDDPASEMKMREKLEKAVADEPNKHFDWVLDRFANALIMQKLGG